MIIRKLFFLIFAFACFNILKAQENNYNVGVGISDVTGQIAETNFFGFGDVFARNSGIRDRQYARAFIVQDPGDKPVVYVCLDKGAMFQSVNVAVMKKLKSLYGDLYADQNVAISATHTHVSPGGYSYYQLYDLSVGWPSAFYKTNFDILVDGIVDAISKAHHNLAPGRIYYNTGSLHNASINRSLVAYNANKDSKKFPNIDPEMTVLKFMQSDKEVGMISFFGVHPTSLSKSFRLCSGDNKGYAALKFERLKKSTYNKGENTFVAAFSNTNAGDMSPNLNLPSPEDLSSDAYGPGRNDEESANIIGGRQFNKALELYNSANKQLFGSVKAVSRYCDYSKVDIESKFTDGKPRKTCSAALGISFRAGAEDARSGISREGLLRDPKKSNSHLDICHMEKAIDPLFILGADEKNPRSPKILPTSILKIGQLGLLTGPGEFTIMSGRRIKSTVAKHKKLGFKHLVFVGYTDAYSGYITTREEYSTQQYEGASTHFGPWTLAAYRQNFDRLAKKLINPKSNPWSEVEPAVPDMKPFSGDKTPVILFDESPVFKDFGDVSQDVNPSYKTGDLVTVTFWGAHPNNDPKTNDTYFEVQKKTNKGWKSVYTDRDTNTKLTWKRVGIAYSKIKIDLAITPDVKGGNYRIVHYGKWKEKRTGDILPYTGTSKTFKVVRKRTRANSGVIFTNDDKTNIDEINNNIVIYPNPTAGEVNFVNNNKFDLQFEVYDLLGRVVKTGAISAHNSYKFNFKSPQGSYFIRYTDKQGNVYQSILTKK